jgi:CrcB protein
MITYLWVAIGSAFGGCLRYWMSGVIDSAHGETFPLGTLIINILGSFVIGFFATFTGPDGRIIVPSDTRVFVMVGICGGFTTFSAFSLQTLNLARDGDFLRAGMNVVLSVALCLLFVWVGHIMATTLNQMK